MSAKDELVKMLRVEHEKRTGEQPSGAEARKIERMATAAAEAAKANKQRPYQAGRALVSVLAVCAAFLLLVAGLFFAPAPKTAHAGSGVQVSVNTNKAANVDAAIPAATGQILVGFAARESAAGAAVATFTIMHGATVGAGTSVYPVELNPNESRSEWFWPGIDVRNGVSINVMAGTVDVDLFFMN